MKNKYLAISFFLLFNFVATLITQANTLFSSSLVFDLPLDGSAVDTGPYGFTVSTNGGATWVPNRFSQPNSALSLNGVNQYIVIPYDARLFPNEFTLSGWFNFQQFSPACLWRAGDSGADGWHGYRIFNYTGTFLNYQDYNGSYYDIGGSVYSTNIVINQWYHYVVTRTSNSCAVFLNGVMMESQSGGMPYAKPQFSPITIGSENGSGGTFWQVTVDNLHIYNRALTPSEVWQLYNYESSATNTMTVDNSLILWNKLGSDMEVSNSAYGPNLKKYSDTGSGGGIDGAANTAYGPGVFGNALTIGPGSYSPEERVHNVVFDNMNQYINADRGTIDVWFKQMSDPVAYQYSTRIFDGAFGFGCGINFDVVPAPDKLGFGVQFGSSSYTRLEFDNSAFNGTWINLAGVWDRDGIDGTSDKVRLYVNGQIVAASSTATWGNTVGSRADIGGGTDYNCAGQFYLDNLQVYNRALSSNEVIRLYNGGETPVVLQSQLQLIQDLTNSTAVLGQNCTLNISATSPAPLSYQWYWIPANDIGQQAGASAQTISSFVYGAVVTNGGFGYGNIPNVAFVGGGGSGAAGYATVSNGSVTSIAVTNAGFGYSGAPTVVMDPPNGLLIGQTNSTLTITNANQNSLGSYFVVVSNNNGSMTSSIVNITLLYPPSISFNPVGFSAGYGTSNSLNVVAAGTPPLSYQWFLNGTNLNNATDSSFSISGMDLTNAGAYTVEVINPYGTAYSSPAYVYMTPSLIAPFTGAIGLWGQNIPLSVGAVGSGTLNYQWYFNGNLISGATASTLPLNSIQFTNAGLYSVTVSSAYGSVSNAAYQVVVNPANTALGLCPMVYISGTAGYTYTIQSSTDLSNTNSWSTLTNLTIPYTPYIWTDPATDTTKQSNPKKFYRVLPGQ